MGAREHHKYFVLSADAVRTFVFPISQPFKPETARTFLHVSALLAGRFFDPKASIPKLL
jgi:hypothetical protein